MDGALADGRLMGARLVEDPYPFFTRLREEAPVWRVPETDAFLVSTWDLVTEATGRIEAFSNHFRHALFDEDGAVAVMDLDVGGAPDVFAGADPPDHTEHRRLFFPELVQRKMDVLADVVASATDELLDDLLRHDRFDVVDGLANPLPLRIMAERVVGFRDVDTMQLQRWMLAGSRFMGGRLRLDEMGAVGEEAAGLLPWVTAQLDDALAALAEDGRRADTGHVLDSTAAGVHAGILTRDEAAFTLMILLGAGAETTSGLIGNALRILAERPDVADALRHEPGDVPAFVEEVLRLESPFRFHPRTARGSVELGGVAIPDGALVMLLWGSANRDPSVFERPDELVMHRPNAPQHLGFGRGIHHCVGAPLARIEARVVLTRLLERTVHIGTDPHGPARWDDNLWMRRHEQLPIVVQAR